MNVFSAIENEVDGHITSDMRKQWNATRVALSAYNKRGEAVSDSTTLLDEAKRKAADIIANAERDLQYCTDLMGDAETAMNTEWESLRITLGDEFYDSEPYALENYVE